MDIDNQSLENHLRVGETVIVQLGGVRNEDSRFRSVLRGWHVGCDLLLDRLRGRFGAYEGLQPDQSCILRFVATGMAVAFDAHVIDWQSFGSEPLMRVTWPERIECRCFRRHDRHPVDLPCCVRAEGDEEFQGRLRDISLGGCGFSTSAHLSCGTQIKLRFTLLGGIHVNEIEAFVRAVHQIGEDYFLGCEFCPDQPALEDVRFYSSIAQHITDPRAKKAELFAPCAILLDADLETSAAIKRVLKRNGCDGVCAQNPIDALHRLRALGAQAIAVNVANMAGVARQLSELLRAVPEYSDLPIFAYGDGAHSHTEIVTQCFALSDSMSSDVAFALKGCLLRGQAVA